MNFAQHGKPLQTGTIQHAFSGHLAKAVRAAVVLVMATAALIYVAFSLHWQMTADTPVMHYVVLLMRHGFRPYAQITDNNLPGAYLTEAAAMRLFGSGDEGWRLYEFFLLGVLTTCAAFLTRRVDWVAGVLAGGTFLAFHAGEGPQFAAERELVITVIVLLACVFFDLSMTRRRSAWMLPLGVSVGLAVSIKPTFLLFALVLLLAAAVILSRQGIRLGTYLWWALAGMSGVGLVCLAFLLHFGALDAFAYVLTKVIPTYAGTAPPPWSVIIRAALPRSLSIVTILVLPLAVLQARDGWRWERWVLLLGAGAGFGSFLAQRKGFSHHRYTFLVFLLLLITMELHTALSRRGWTQIWAAIVIASVLFGFVPKSLKAGAAIPSQTAFSASLLNDFERLGGAQKLQNKVFCFDLIYGCLNALYHGDLVESAPFTGDLLFFPKQYSVASEYYRKRFWAMARETPPEVLVISNEDLLNQQGFDRVKMWPAFADYLQHDFVEVAERRFPHERFGVSGSEELPSSEQDAYRIYVRRRP